MFGYYKKSLVDLFQRLQGVSADPENSSVECCNIQDLLIRRIMHIEHRIQRSKQRISELKRLLAAGPDTRMDKSRAREIKEAIKYTHWVIDQYQKLLVVFRIVGDGLIFTYVSRWDVKPMIFKEKAGFLSGKKGFAQEKKVLRFVCKAGKIAILNDLTNCMRHGDITVPKDGAFLLIEMKTSKNTNARTARQEENLQKIGTYLQTDEITGLYRDGLPMSRISVHEAERDYIEELNQTIADAFANGSAIRRVEEGLYYCAEIASNHLDLDVVIKQFAKPPAVLLLNAGKYANFGYFPFSLSIHDPEALYAFYTGGLLLMVIIDVEVMYKRLKEHGLQMEFLGKDEWGLAITPFEFIGTDHPGPAKISHHFFMRVPYEFLSLDWFLNEIIYRVGRAYRQV